MNRSLQIYDKILKSNEGTCFTHAIWDQNIKIRLKQFVFLKWCLIVSSSVRHAISLKNNLKTVGALKHLDSIVYINIVSTIISSWALTK